MNRLTIAQAVSWQPERLTELAEEWDRAAGMLQGHADTLDQAAHTTSWAGSAADAALSAAIPAAAGLRLLCRALILAAAQARDGALTLAAARDQVLGALAAAQAQGCSVSEDGAVRAPSSPPELLVACSGGSPAAAMTMLDARCAELTRQLQDSLDRLGVADTDAARAIDAAFDITPGPAAVRPAGVAGPDVGGWPTLSQDRIAGQLATLSPTERTALVEQRPHEVGNTDGVP